MGSKGPLGGGQSLKKASHDTSLEYPHGVVWNILKITFFKDWPPWHTWPIFDVWSALFKQGGILHICIDDQAPFYRNG